MSSSTAILFLQRTRYGFATRSPVVLALKEFLAALGSLLPRVCVIISGRQPVPLHVLTMLAARIDDGAIRCLEWRAAVEAITETPAVAAAAWAWETRMEG